MPAKLRRKASIEKGDTLLVRLVGNQITMEPLDTPEVSEWSLVLHETEGTWHDVDPHGIADVDEIIARSAATAMYFDAALATRNEKHFGFIQGLMIDRPY